jgi:hypothetical protein
LPSLFAEMDWCFRCFRCFWSHFCLLCSRYTNTRVKGHHGLTAFRLWIIGLALPIPLLINYLHAVVLCCTGSRVTRRRPGGDARPAPGAGMPPRLASHLDWSSCCLPSVRCREQRPVDSPRTVRYHRVRPPNHQAFGSAVLRLGCQDDIGRRAVGRGESFPRGTCRRCSSCHHRCPSENVVLSACEVVFQVLIWRPGCT